MLFSKYKLEGISNPMNIGLAFFVTLIFSMFLGWLYNVIFAALFMIIYLNFIFTIGLGFALAISIQIISKLLKIRERKTRLFLVIFALIIAYYSHWIAYILNLSFEKIPNFSQFISYWIYPENFFLILTDIYKHGTWSFGLSGNLPVKGFVLFLIWLAEALVIFFLAISYTFKFPENPFSQKSNKWYSKLTLDYDFNSFYSEEKIINSLKEEGIDLILNAEKGLAYKYASITVFFLEKEDTQYLSIDNIFIERKNKSKKNTTAILSPITITNKDANKLISKFGTRKEFFLDF